MFVMIFVSNTGKLTAVNRPLKRGCEMPETGQPWWTWTMPFDKRHSFRGFHSIPLKLTLLFAICHLPVGGFSGVDVSQVTMDI